MAQRAPLTVTGVTADNKFYDGTTTATLNTNGAALSGLFSGDTVFFNMSGATGTFAGADVADNVTVTSSRCRGIDREPKVAAKP